MDIEQQREQLFAATREMTASIFRSYEPIIPPTLIHTNPLRAAELQRSMQRDMQTAIFPLVKAIAALPPKPQVIPDVEIKMKRYGRLGAINLDAI